MKRFSGLICMVLTIATLSFVIGCSSGSSDNDLVAGDVNDPEFQFVSEFLDPTELEALGTGIDLAFLFWDSIPGVSAARAAHPRTQSLQEEGLVVEEYSYSYANGWHVFTFSLFVDEFFDTLDMAGIDSVQFLVAGVPMQVPDSTVDGLSIRASVDVGLRSGMLSVSSDQSVDIANLSYDLLTPVTVNGTSHEEAVFVLETDSVDCSFGLTSAMTITDLVGYIEGEDCPSSGRIDVGATVDIDCVGTDADPGVLDVNGGWNASAIYHDGMVDLSYSDGTTLWETTEQCGYAPGVPAFGSWLGRMH